MLNTPLDTKQVTSGMLFAVSLLASAEKKSEKPGEAKYKT